jgi:hypothetical protein
MHEPVVDSRRTIVLCDALVAATFAHDVEWRSDGDDSYRWDHEKGSVSIGSRDKDSQPPYQLAVFNPDRLRVEELSSSLLDNDVPAPWNEPLAELYRAARRSALHADEVIEALIDVLPSRPENAPMRRALSQDAPSSS